MTFLDVAATGALPRLAGWATALAPEWAVAITAPTPGAIYPALAVTVGLLVSSTGVADTDVQVQVDDTADFSSTVHDSTLLALVDGPTEHVVSGLTNATTYYVRARASEDGTGSWSPWTPTVTFRVDTNGGKGIHAVDLNVGPAAGLADPDGVWLVDLNVGPDAPSDPDGVWPVDLNVGFAINLSPDAVWPVDLGDVNEDPPHPHLWFLLPTRGAAGDGINVYCWGVGDTVGQYDGRLEYRDPATGVWSPLSVTSWVTVVAGPDAYTALRKIDRADGIITTQHTVIGFTVPGGAVPPGFSVRIVTEPEV